jgi:hypothetical protein
VPQTPPGATISEDIELFPPFEESLKLLEKPLTNDVKRDKINSDDLQTADGGPSSGRYPKGSGEISESEHVGFDDGVERYNKLKIRDKIEEDS